MTGIPVAEMLLFTIVSYNNIKNEQKKKSHTLHNEIKFLYLLSTTLCMREMGHSNTEHKRK